MDEQLTSIAQNILGFKKKTDKSYDPNILNQVQQAQQSQPQIEDHPQVLKLATNLAVQSGADPGDLIAAKQQLGNKDYIGLCEKFVEQATKGVTGLFASAKDAFNSQQNQIKTDFENMPKGSQIFYGPDQSNGGYGHTAIAAGNGQQIGATDNGVQQSDINQWIQNTGQKLLGYLPPQQGVKT